MALSTFWKTLGHIWASPVTLVGLIVAFVGRAKFYQRDNGCLEFIGPDHGPINAFFVQYRMAAFTLGAVIVYRNVSLVTKHPKLRVHEQRHTYQAMIFGPFMLLLYPLASLPAFLQGKDVHRDNPFEVDARRAAGQ